MADEELKVKYALRYLYGKEERDEIARNFREKYGDAVERDLPEMMLPGDTGPLPGEEYLAGLRKSILGLPCTDTRNRAERRKRKRS
jgi:hypothetical protein